MTRICRECGKEFEAGGRSVYCSPECREAVEKRRNTERHERERMLRPDLICPVCGKTFRPSRTRIFCSRKCADIWNSGRAGQVDMRVAAAADAKKEADRVAAEIERKRKTHGVQRTNTGAIWYPVSGAEIQRIARETHRSYGEVCAEFLGKQVISKGDKA